MYGREEEVFELTREELYQQVWTTPIHTLAKKYNLSDVGLAKICKKHQIPCPPRGYWAKKAHGKATHQIQLPPPKDQELNTIRLVKRTPQAQRELEAPPLLTYDDDIAQIREKALALPQARVPERIGRYHPLIQAHRAVRQSGHRGSYEERKATLNIDVSDEHRKRAYYFLDTLFKTIERLGGQVVTQREHHKDATCVMFAGENAATLRLREKTRRVDHGPKDPLGHTKYDYLPTGLLTLDSWPAGSSTFQIRETAKGKPLEDRINYLILRFIEFAQKVRHQRRMREEAQKREWELRKRRLKLQQQQEEEQNRVDQLVHQAQNWERARLIRALLDAARKMAITQHDHIDDGSEFDLWLKWGFQQADRFDPLCENCPSILDERL